MTDNAHDQRMADYLDTQDAAADWTPEGGDDRELAWDSPPARRPANPYEDES